MEPADKHVVSTFFVSANDQILSKTEIAESSIMENYSQAGQEVIQDAAESAISPNKLMEVMSHSEDGLDESNYHNEDHSIADQFLDLIDELNEQLKDFEVPPPVEAVYNSTEYARQPFEMYVRKYCNTKKNIIFFGMNPGPWGMSQTGVPFGEVKAVKEFLEIEGPVSKPPKELTTRPVDGFACTRSEMSGKRFWGLIKDVCGDPENFFKTSFVYNYLPQQWMRANGTNLTPNEFQTSQLQDLFTICDRIFCKVLELYEVEVVIAIGKFCETRAKRAMKRYTNQTLPIFYLPHPSPRTVNNMDWPKRAKELFANYGLLEIYKATSNPDNAEITPVDAVASTA